MTRNPNQPSVPPAPSLPTPQHNAKRERGAREDAKRERGAKTGYGTRAEVDLAALRHNVATLRAQLAPGSRLIAVVKAGGYGHGARPSAAAALQAGAAALAVGRVSEGLALRAAGIDAPVLVLGYNTAAETEAAVQAGLALTPSCLDDVDAAARAAARLGRPAALHVKVDTGMRRLGLPPAEAAPVIALARTHPGLRLEGLYTHLACADDPDPAPSEQQFQRFRDFAAGVDPHHQLTWHVCNTAAARRFPHMHLDAVRVGIGLYGIDPRNVDPGNINTASYAPALDLRPALTLRSTILRCFDLAPCESLGYGASFTATTPLRIATVACGYADGLPRALSNRGAALVRGQRCPIVGRISMDLCTVDVSAAGPSAGDDVVFIGRQGDAAISAGEVADLAGTISYELLCQISSRVPRSYDSETAPPAPPTAQ